tara:strand:- start:151 stop:366 length:216 start_codon:yes stop_codon:yes gene_type:complete
MDEIIISNNIKVDLITRGINTPAMLPMLITIRIFGFNGDPVMNDRITDTIIEIVKAHNVPTVKAVIKIFFL